MGDQFEVAGLPVTRVVELFRRNVLETVQDHPHPSYGGKSCQGAKREKQMCNKQPCPDKNALQREYLVYLIV